MTFWKSSIAAAMVFGLAVASSCRKHERTPSARPEPMAPAAPRVSTSDEAPPEASAAPAVSLQPTKRAATIPELQRIVHDKGAFVPVTQGDGPDFEVLPDMRQNLVALKNALLRTVDRNFERMLEKPFAADALEKMLVAEGVIWASEKGWEDGAIDGSLIAAPKHRERWLMTLCILVSPGSDCLAAVYERRGGTTHRAMVFRNDDYASIDGAVHALHCTLSPPDGDDRFYLLEAHTYPWVSSVWRDFSYSARVPGTTPDSSEPVARDKGYANWVEGFDLKARLDGFTVGFSTQDDDVAKFTKPVVHRWRKTVAGFERRD